MNSNRITKGRELTRMILNCRNTNRILKINGCSTRTSLAKMKVKRIVTTLIKKRKFVQ